MKQYYEIEILKKDDSSPETEILCFMSKAEALEKYHHKVESGIISIKNGNHTGAANILLDSNLEVIEKSNWNKNNL